MSIREIPPKYRSVSEAGQPNYRLKRGSSAEPASYRVVRESHEVARREMRTQVVVGGATGGRADNRPWILRRQRVVDSSTFDALVAAWRRDTAYSSSIHEIAMHVAYQQMIALGPITLPLILRALEEEPDPSWFWALRALAQVDAAVGEDTVQGATDAWLSWGRSNHLVA